MLDQGRRRFRLMKMAHHRRDGVPPGCVAPVHQERLDRLLRGLLCREAGPFPVAILDVNGCSPEVTLGLFQPVSISVHAHIMGQSQ